jgi:hypothetical protein
MSLEGGYCKPGQEVEENLSGSLAWGRVVVCMGLGSQRLVELSPRLAPTASLVLRNLNCVPP